SALVPKLCLGTGAAKLRFAGRGREGDLRGRRSQAELGNEGRTDAPPMTKEKLSHWWGIGHSRAAGQLLASDTQMISLSLRVNRQRPANAGWHQTALRPRVERVVSMTCARSSSS